MSACCWDWYDINTFDNSLNGWKNINILAFHTLQRMLQAITLAAETIALIQI